MTAADPLDRAGEVLTGVFGPQVDRRSAVDRAHLGDIKGALGTVSSLDTAPRETRARRIATLLAIMGPGLLVMVADNDAGGIATYAQAGQEYGTRLVGLLCLVGVVLFVNQEMASRLGAVTGAGHARLILERFGRRWGAFALGDLLVLNLLTLVTEFVGVSLSLGYFGVSRFVSVPAAALLLVGASTTGSFRRWERAMGLAIVTSLVVVPLIVLVGLHRSAPRGVTASRRRRGSAPRRRGAPHHRPRGHDRRAVAALLPSVEHRRQENPGPLPRIRAR